MKIIKCERCGKQMAENTRTNMCNKCIKTILNQKYGKDVIFNRELEAGKEFMKKKYGPPSPVYTDTDDILKVNKDYKICVNCDRVNNIKNEACVSCGTNNFSILNTETRPDHYQGKIECIEAIKVAISGLEGTQAFHTGNIIKYLWRWNNKNGLEDLKKAKTYLDWLIQEVDNEG